MTKRCAGRSLPWRREEVGAILGEPTESSGMSFGALSGDTWVWKTKGTTIAIQFLGGKVLAKQLNRQAH